MRNLERANEVRYEDLKPKDVNRAILHELGEIHERIDRVTRALSELLGELYIIREQQKNFTIRCEMNELISKAKK